jgi:multidrug efflux pump subunit AcrA (membrane-fusion protein)
LGSLISARLATQSLSLLSVPQSALTGGPEAPQVWRVGHGRKVALVPVTLGAALEDHRVVVTAGLTGGDEIVVRGVHSLTDGQTVGPAIGSLGNEGAN